MPTLEFFVGIFLLFLFSSFYYGILAAIGIPMACWLTGDGLGILIETVWIGSFGHVHEEKRWPFWKGSNHIYKIHVELYYFRYH